MADGQTIEQRILSRVGKRAEDAAFSWVLSKVGVGGSSSLPEEIGRLAAAVERVEKTLQSFIEIYKTTTAFNSLRDVVITPAAGDIDARYDELQALQPHDTDLAVVLASADSEIKYDGALDRIDRAFRGTVTGVPGELIELAVDQVLARICFPGYSVNDTVALMKAYGDLEAFFHGMVDVQIRGCVLKANAANYHDHHDRAEAAAAKLNANLANHALRFLTAVERLTATYSCDVSLLRTIGDPATNPIRAAHNFIQRIPEAQGSRVWMWNGTGSGYSLSTGIPMPTAIGLSEPRTFVNQEWRSDDPKRLGRDGDFWITARYCFPPDTPTQLSYPFVKGGEQLPVNAVIKPKISTDPLRMPFSGTLRFVTDVSGPETTFVPVSSLAISNGYAITPDLRAYGERGDSFTIEAWIRPETPGMLFGGNGWYLALNGDGSLTLKDQDSQPLQTWPTLEWNYWHNHWHHVAVMSDWGRGATGIMIDGRFGPGYWHALPLSILTFGGHPVYSGIAGVPPTVSDPISASYNEVRVWFRLLTDIEMQTDMQTIVTSGSWLACVYGLDQCNLNERSGQHSPLNLNRSANWTFTTPAPLWLPTDA